MDLISVVIPIYNVEAYLCDCLESVVAQTYKNLEIILVDDGSPDDCPQLCDEWQKKDSRIRVIHKKNGGLSDARNAGIAVATGKYISFVDSDDWIEKTMIENLYQTCLKFGTQISCCGRYLTNEKTVKGTRFCSQTRNYSSEEALKEILISGSIDVAAWDKLYLLSLFDNIRYPVGENNEDIAIFYTLVDKAGAIAHCGTNEYYYRSRPGSITKIKYRERDTQIILKNLENLGAFIKNKYPSLEEYFQKYRAMNLYYILNKYVKCNESTKREEYQILKNEFSLLTFWGHSNVCLKEKVIALLLWFNLYSAYLTVKNRLYYEKHI